ncbi:TPA: hypothetical protein ACFRG8_001348 [Neisseria lactamica]
MPSERASDGIVPFGGRPGGRDKSCKVASMVKQRLYFTVVIVDEQKSGQGGEPQTVQIVRLGAGNAV